MPLRSEPFYIRSQSTNIVYQSTAILTPANNHDFIGCRKTDTHNFTAHDACNMQQGDIHPK
jgi:hypothetical protein